MVAGRRIGRCGPRLGALGLKMAGGPGGRPAAPQAARYAAGRRQPLTSELQRETGSAVATATGV